MGYSPTTTKEKLFFAGLHVFASKGYAAATIRDICRLAESGNMNAVNYHFGGKAGLYKAILEVMFSELGKRIESEDALSKDLTPEERLCEVLRIYCAMLFGGGEIGSQFVTIYITELAQPSPFLNELIDLHMVRQNKELLNLVDEIIGPGAPRWLLQDCGVSVFSQVIYYTTTWTLYSRVAPDHPGMAVYHEHLAEHVCRFSLAGLAEMKRAWEAGELVAPGDFAAGSIDE